ncbi:MAG: HD domain-containing protein [Clostridia bacterium]|nr:HD domain-containing protein [Clostridia bacterium]
MFEQIKNAAIGSNISDNCNLLLEMYHKDIVLLHTKNVAEKVKEIAEKYKLNSKWLDTAAYLHDISIVIPRNEYAEICYEYGIKTIAIEIEIPVLMHQKISALIAKEVFNVTDNEILSAIACHTTLKENPSKFDMALFIADKIMWDQEGTPPYLGEVETALNISLEKACLVYIDYMLDNDLYLSPHPDVISARKFLIAHSDN